MNPAGVTRRSSFRHAIALAFAGGAAAVVQAQPGDATRTLVAYLSRSGNTRVVAGQIARANGAAVFEIQPMDPYPDDYRQTVARAARESAQGFEPPLLASLPDIARYSTVFLGFPIWGMTVPPPVRSFLSRHDLAGKTLVPFITHGGYGTGNSLAVVRRMAAKARIGTAFVMQGDQERDTLERVTRWLERRPARS
jgi:flavodoxin